MATNDTDVAALIFETIPLTMRKIRSFLRESAKAELTVPQMRILAHVFRGTNMAVELAELQGVSLAAISKMVESLVKRNLLERQYKENNRKQIFLNLTDKGRELYFKNRKVAQQKLALALKSASTQDKIAIGLGMRALNALMSAKSSNKESTKNSIENGET